MQVLRPADPQHINCILCGLQIVTEIINDSISNALMTANERPGAGFVARVGGESPDFLRINRWESPQS